jgi:GNAT superfamily N-acetyltransferase
VSDIRVEKVKTNGDLAKFIKFPWAVYQNDPNWVPPLISDMKEKVDRQKNPFFEHAKMDLYLAYKGSALTGRIAAIVDEAHNRFHAEKTVFFGLYESLNDFETSRTLIEAAAAWGKEKGMDTLRGPMNLSMNDECAFLLEGFDSPPAVMMPYNPPFYLELMEKNGLLKAKDLYAFYMTREHTIQEKVRTLADKARQELNATIRTVNLKKADEEAEKVAYIYNHGWERNWGFVPWTDREMSHMVNKLKMVADPDLVIFAEIDGRTVGFAFGLPNYSEILIKMNGRLLPFGIIKLLLNRKKIKGMRAVVFGLLKEYRQTGLSYLLYSELEKNAIRKGYEWGEMSWQLEDNEAINRFVLSIGAKVYKKYRIFEKKIC